MQRTVKVKIYRYMGYLNIYSGSERALRLASSGSFIKTLTYWWLILKGAPIHQNVRGSSTQYFHECWAHWRLQVLQEHLSEAALLPDIPPHEFISRPGVIVKSTSMHIMWDDIVEYCASELLPYCGWLWFMRLVGSRSGSLMHTESALVWSACHQSVDLGSFLPHEYYMTPRQFPVYISNSNYHPPIHYIPLKASTPTHPPPQYVTVSVLAHRYRVFLIITNGCLFVLLFLLFAVMIITESAAIWQPCVQSH